MYGTLTTSVADIPAGTVVQVLALAVGGEARTLILYEGKTARLPNEVCLQLNSCW